MSGGVMSQLRSRLAAWQAFRVVLWLTGAIGGIALAAIALDAAVDLPDAARVAVPWLAGLCALVIVARGWLQNRRMTEYESARIFEQSGASPGNRLSNAVQMAGRAGATPVEEYLRLETIELGRQTAAPLKAWPVVRSAVRAAATGAVVVTALWAGMALFGGNVLESVLPRFTDPRGDHPPFSNVHLEVAPGAVRVLYGGQLDVKARVSGQPVDRLWLVAQAGTNVIRAAMFLAPDKSFFQSLANLREPVM
jgi:hypothetical protein